MAHIYFNTVPYLINICSVDIFPESSFNTSTILKILLKNASDKNTQNILNFQITNYNDYY